MESILNSIKTLLGIQIIDTSFDNELVIHINSALAVLSQLGTWPVNGLKITGPTETWSYVLISPEMMEDIKLAVYFRVRLSFDPPASSFVLESMKKQLDELEWRIEVAISDDF